MRRRPLLFAALVVLSLVGYFSVANAEPQKWAVVVGIGQYRDASIPSLRYAGADARAMHDFLVDPKGGAFPRSHVTLLIDQQATQVALRSALGTVLARNAVKG